MGIGNIEILSCFLQYLCFSLRLRDPCPSVRQTATLVMTHLILKDMVKVKGQVSEMATLLIDPEEAIMGVAQNFFSELSKKASGCSGPFKRGEGLVEVESITQVESWRKCVSGVEQLSVPLCCLNEGRSRKFFNTSFVSTLMLLNFTSSIHIRRQAPNQCLVLLLSCLCLGQGWEQVSAVYL